MPLIVDEVIVSVEVSNQASGGAASGPGQNLDKQAIVAECVERLLDILREREER